MPERLSRDDDLSADFRLLRDIYQRALDRCTPERLVLRAIDRDPLDGTFDVAAVGKCAAGLLAGAAARVEIARAFLAVPQGYPITVPMEAEIAFGSHPQLDSASFDAGDRLQRFVSSSLHPLLVLVSGGASASVELPLIPWFSEDDVRHVNAILLRSGLPIDRMNVVRKHISGIKGGRLITSISSSCTTLVYSDVAPGRLADVGSGPTLPDPSTNEDAAAILERLSDPRCRSAAVLLRSGEVPETPKALRGAVRLIADNTDLVAAAADAAVELGVSASPLGVSLDDDVESGARRLLASIRLSDHRVLLVAGGEPTITVQGDGKGGRCSELALRFLRAAAAEHLRFSALFGSSDGVDGNSGAAGVYIDDGAAAKTAVGEIDDAIAASDSFGLVQRIGEPIMMQPTGNNLRDLFLLMARG
ncbi:MAG TPA: DUF4147 domain-containing protein [Thermoanaerobaculia bacterium]|nr:DUF4147 domain-containing protein [Thermoanaerobaculia bacterium]